MKLKLTLLSLSFSLIGCAAPKGDLVHGSQSGNIHYKGGTGLVYSRPSASDAMYAKYNTPEMEVYTRQRFGQLDSEINKSVARQRASDLRQQAIKKCDKKIDLAVAILKSQASHAIEEGNLSKYEALNKQAHKTEYRLLKEQNTCIDQVTKGM